MAEFAYHLPVSVVCRLLGVPAEHWDWFQPLVFSLTVATEASLDTSRLTSPNKAADELNEYFGMLITARQSEPRGDLISLLAAPPEPDMPAMDQNALLANVVFLSVAGPRRRPTCSETASSCSSTTARGGGS